MRLRHPHGRTASCRSLLTRLAIAAWLTLHAAVWTGVPVADAVLGRHGGDRAAWEQGGTRETVDGGGLRHRVAVDDACVLCDLAGAKAPAVRHPQAPVDPELAARGALVTRATPAPAGIAGPGGGGSRAPPGG
jgi:hypothetical protein